MEGRGRMRQLYVATFCLLMLIWIELGIADSDTCNCTSRDDFVAEDTRWQVLSFLMSVLGCTCVFLIGSFTNSQSLFLCRKDRKMKTMPQKSWTTILGVPAVSGIPQQTAATAASSIMEQLVPEITYHVLSYLDYRSLCCMSMTNSVMRRAANDESSWKSLYHKDFTAEQSSIVPKNGWKEYYAVTRAVTEVNRAFYRKFKAKSLRGMGRLWLNADYVKCVHPGGELITGYDAVMENWRLVFSWRHVIEFVLQEMRVRVMGDMAWVTNIAYVNASTPEPLLSTNCYEFHHGHWYIVHHHCSPQFTE